MLRFLPRNQLPPDPETLAALHPYRGVMARLLHARGITDAAQAERFLHPAQEHLHDPWKMHGMEQAVHLIAAAKEKRISAVVYGDYDVDGMCAAALLTDALRRYGLEATPHIPLREEGYGLNMAAAERLAQEYGLLITVDLGITNHEEVARAKELDMTVIVTDHHQLPLADSPADAVLSPLLSDYPCPKLCGAGVAFKLAQALLGPKDASQYLDLAALATVADIVPLTDENRALVALGLPVIEARKREGMRALLAVSGSGEKIDSETLGFQLGPRLNAAGRLSDANQGVRLMMTNDPREADAIAQALNTLNTRRKAMENEVLAQADIQAQAHDFVQERALIVRGKGWHVGVIGLAAGRLCQRYGCPTAALSEEDGVLRGSLRSVPGVNIHKCLQACDDLLLRYGGHEQAAGVTLASENYDAFCQRLQKAVRHAACEDAFIPSQEYDLSLSFADISETLAQELSLLAPFGLGNPSPLFLAQAVQLERRRACGADGSHLQLTLREAGRVLDGIAFGKGKMAPLLPDRVDAVFSLRLDTFRGVTTVKCDVKALSAAQDAAMDALHHTREDDFEQSLLAGLEEVQAQLTKAGKSPLLPEINMVMDFSSLPAPSRGVLYVARTRETAERLLQQFLGPAGDGSPLELAYATPHDPLCFATLLLLPKLSAVKGRWRQVFLLDGEMIPGEAALWQEQLSQAQITVCSQSPALQALAAGIDPGDEAYRRLYRLLRKSAFATLPQTAEAAGLTPAQTRAGLLAFAQLSLITFTENPFGYALLPPAPCELSQSKVLRALREMAHGKVV